MKKPRPAELLVLAMSFAQLTLAADWYVATNGTGDGTNNWANATNSIQGAINASLAGDTVWVSNGVYETGGRTNFPVNTSLTNRVAIYKAVTVRSANNDPTNTIIKGAWGSATNSSTAVRCVYMTNGSSLIGFMLTNGATRTTNESAQANDRYGGGVYCQSTNTVISNCLITGNSASGSDSRGGGGVSYGTLYNCIVDGNSVNTNTTVTVCGGGAEYAVLYNCAVINNSARSGGGVNRGNLYNCAVVSNSAALNGGGVFWSVMYNCLVVGNSANNGGGMSYSVLYNCTVAGNAAVDQGGGLYRGTSINSIVYFNAAVAGSNWWYLYAGTPCFQNSCTAPTADVWTAGNITDNPLLVNPGSGYGTNHVFGDYRLSRGSPSINTGTNFGWMSDPADARRKDLDGHRRVDKFSGVADMGCYEYLPRGIMINLR